MFECKEISKDIVQNLIDWDTISDEEVARTKSEIGRIFGLELPKMGVLQQSGKCYVINTLHSGYIAVHIEYGLGARVGDEDNALDGWFVFDNDKKEVKVMYPQRGVGLL